LFNQNFVLIKFWLVSKENIIGCIVGNIDFGTKEIKTKRIKTPLLLFKIIIKESNSIRNNFSCFRSVSLISN
jgi:hypothetical protein